MSSLREDISALFDTELTCKKHLTPRGDPAKYDFMGSILYDMTDNTDIDEVLSKFNLSFKLVEENVHDYICDYIYMFSRADNESIFDYVKITTSSYRAAKWEFVTPKLITKVVYS